MARGWVEVLWRVCGIWKTSSTPKGRSVVGYLSQVLNVVHFFSTHRSQAREGVYGYTCLSFLLPPHKGRPDNEILFHLQGLYQEKSSRIP
jgi:hypothetical protein